MLQLSYDLLIPKPMAPGQLAANLQAIEAAVNAVVDSQVVVKDFNIAADTTDWFTEDLIGATILSIIRNNLAETNFTQVTDSDAPNRWHLLFPDGLFAGEKLWIVYRKSLS